MITLREKTMKKLNEQQRFEMASAINKTSIFTHNEMQEMIWRLTYQPKMAVQELGFSEDIPEALYQTIRAELANQYRDEHPEWGYGKARTVDNETNALWKALGGDQYAYNTVRLDKSLLK